MTLLSNTVLIGALLIGCSSSEKKDNKANGTAGTSGITDPNDAGGIKLSDAGLNGSDAPAPCMSQGGDDQDGDGFSVADGDCNDCDANVNPGAFDIAGNSVDEDCDKQIDNPPAECDQDLDIAADDPIDAAKSLGICKLQSGDSWGLVKARWTYPDGSEVSVDQPEHDLARLECPDAIIGVPPPALARGILPKFGDHLKPRQGSNMVALSSGIAREGTKPFTSPSGTVQSSPQSAYHCVFSATPPGFPKSSPSCAHIITAAEEPSARDAIALELTIRVPHNARGFSFDFNFHAYEFPDFVCSPFNDFFVALLDSTHTATPSDKNISFDAKGNPVSVNNAFMEVCEKDTPTKAGVSACALGPTELEGTGFSDPKPRAATGWLRTTASVTPGETIVLRFAIWDAGDPRLDATVLLDNFTWVAEGGTTAPVTERPK